MPTRSYTRGAYNISEETRQRLREAGRRGNAARAARPGAEAEAAAKRSETNRRRREEDPEGYAAMVKARAERRWGVRGIASASKALDTEGGAE